MNSPAMQAALSAIGSNTNSIQASSGYEGVTARAQGVKAQHEIELARCKRHASKGAKRVERCRNFETKKIVEQQAIIDQYSKSSTSRQNAITGNTQALIDKVQVLQQDESQHAAIIRFFKEFGISSMGAMMFVAFILVNAFELGFHYSGSRVGHLKSALAQIGYDLQDKTNDFDIQKGKMDLLRLRDAAKTKKEVEVLKAKIKELSSNDHSDHSPTPANESDNVVPMKANTAVDNSPAIGFKLPEATNEKAQYVSCRSCGKQANNTVGANGFCSTKCESKTSPDISLKQDSMDGYTEGLKQDSCASTENGSKTSFSDTDLLYPEWKKAVVLKQCGLTARRCRTWVKKELNAHTSKQVKKVTDKYASTIVDLLYIRGLKAGIISLNPKWKEGSRVVKYLLA